MTSEPLGATPTLRCGHCGNRAPLRVRARDSRVETHEHATSGGYQVTWDAGTVFEILGCPACDGTLLAKYEYHDQMLEDGVEYQICSVETF